LKRITKVLVAGLLGLAGVAATPAARAQDATLLNVSYDPTRELYTEINQLFAEKYKEKTGKSVKIEQSHGGSSKQARAVVDGLRADVVTLALASDIQAIEDAGLMKAGWEKRPHNATPYASTIVFVVRKGNPKGVKDWNDLVKPGIGVVTPNPKTSGGARWNFLAAWGYAAGLPARDVAAIAGDAALSGAANDSKPAVLDDAKGRAFVEKLFANVPVLDTGARGSTVTFAQKNVGDVLIAWENEACLAKEEFKDAGFEIVYPSVTILAEPPVAIVDTTVEAKKMRELAEAYLSFLYTEEAQDVIGANHYRPRSKEAAKRYEKELPPIKVFDIAAFGGWRVAQKHYFADGGVWDTVIKKK